MSITLTDLQDLLARRFGGVLLEGKHCEDGQACVRELRAAALALPWSDHPDGDEASPTDQVCQRLNDAQWSSDAARTEGCLPLALLSEHTAPAGWVMRYVELTIRRVVPLALRDAADQHPNPAHARAMRAVADRCETEGSYDAASAAASDAASAALDASAAAWAAASAAAWAAASDAASDAASAALDASAAASAAARAASAAASAASAAASDAASDAWTAAADNVLRVGVACLLEAHGRADLIGARE